MNSSTITLSGLPVAIGLHWRGRRDTERSAKFLSGLIKDMGRAYGVIIKGDDVDSIGFASEGSKAPSAAQWLARAAGDAPTIVVEPLAEGQFWFCAVNHGAPVTDVSDTIASLAEATELVDDLMGRWSALQPVLYAPEGLFSFPSEHTNFADIVADADKPPGVKRLQPSILPAVVAISVVTALIAGGLYYYNTNKKAAMIAARIAAQAKAAAAQLALSKSTVEKAQAQYAAKLKAIEDELSAPTVSERVASWMLVAGRLPTEDGGWELTNIDCDAALCESRWARKVGAGTVSDFVRLSTAIPVETYSAQSFSGVYRHQISGAASFSRPISELPTWAVLGPSLITVVQKYEAIRIKGMVYEAAPNATVIIDPELKAPKLTAAENVMTLPVRFGAWGVEGALLGDLEDYVKKLPTNLTVDKLSISVVGDITTWKLEGKYAVK